MQENKTEQIKKPVEEDKREFVINHAGYWELDEKSKNKLIEQEKKKEVQTFMKLHKKQLYEIMKLF